MNIAPCLKRSLLLFLLSACLLCGLASATLAASPLDSIRSAQAAVDANDPDAFFNYVDINSVLDKGMDDIIAALQRQAGEGNLDNSNPLLLLILAGLSGENQSQRPFFKQLLASELRTFVVTGISGGYFAGNPTGQAKPSGISGALLKGISKGRKEIAPNAVLSRDNKQAMVSATFTDKKAGAFPLELRMEPVGDHWQIKEVTNAEQLVRLAAKSTS